MILDSKTIREKILEFISLNHLQELQKQDFEKYSVSSYSFSWWILKFISFRMEWLDLFDEITDKYWYLIYFEALCDDCILPQLQWWIKNIKWKYNNWERLDSIKYRYSDPQIVLVLWTDDGEELRAFSESTDFIPKRLWKYLWYNNNQEWSVYYILTEEFSWFEVHVPNLMKGEKILFKYLLCTDTTGRDNEYMYECDVCIWHSIDLILKMLWLNIDKISKL